MKLSERINQLVAIHGSFRKAGEALGIGHSHLAVMARKKRYSPSIAILEKLGLNPVADYSLFDSNNVISTFENQYKDLMCKLPVSIPANRAWLQVKNAMQELADSMVLDCILYDCTIVCDYSNNSPNSIASHDVVVTIMYQQCKGWYHREHFLCMHSETIPAGIPAGECTAVGALRPS